MAGYREDSVMEFMDSLRSEEAVATESRLDALHAAYGASPSTYDRRLVSLALGAHYLERQPRLALQYLSAADLDARDGDPLLPVVRYYLAQAKMKSGAYREAMALADGLASETHGAHWGRLFYGTEIEAAFGAGDFDRLVAAFERYTKNYSFSRHQESLAHFAAVALEKKGETTRATEVLEEIARSYPTTDESRWAFNRLQDLACDTETSGRPKYYFSARLLLALSRNAVLETGIKDFIIASLERPLLQEDGSVRLMSAMERGEFLFKARLFREALTVARESYEIERAKPDSKILADVLFDLGRIHLRLWEPVLAARYFSLLLADFPRHALAVRAQENLGDALRNAGLPLDAADSYAAAAGQKDSRLLRWHHFWSLYRAKKFAEALALLERPGYVQPRDGDDDLTVTYWHARVLERLGRAVEADARYTKLLTTNAESYYANLVAAIRPDLVDAAKTLAEPARGDAPPGFALAAKALSPRSEASPLLASVPSLKLVGDLRRVGLDNAAKIHLAGLKWNDFGGEAAFAAASKVALELDDYNPARRIKYSTFSSLRTLPENWWDYVSHQAKFTDEWKIFYPLAFEKAVSAVTAKIRLDPFLVLSIMRTESFYNKEARSGVGAQGLMQLMPYTATKIAALINDQRFDVLDLAKPEVNIAYGSYYLDKLMRYYGDNPFLAVAAYNGGPVAVNQWRDSCNDCAADEFVESIQYRETRRYVREVMRSYAQYVRIYTGQQALGELPRMPAQLPDGEEIF